MAVKKGILPFVCVTDLADYVSSDLSGKVFSEPSRPAMLEFVMVSWQRFWFFFFFFFFYVYIFFFWVSFSACCCFRTDLTLTRKTSGNGTSAFT